MLLDACKEAGAVRNDVEAECSASADSAAHRSADLPGACEQRDEVILNLYWDTRVLSCHA
jgi:hypothetical protein